MSNLLNLKKEQYTSRLQIMITPSLMEKISKDAKKNKVKESNLVRAIIEQYYKR